MGRQAQGRVPIYYMTNFSQKLHKNAGRRPLNLPMHLLTLSTNLFFQDQEQKTGLSENINVTIHEKGFTPIQ